MTGVPASAPFVRLPAPIPVLIAWQGEQWPGFALAWQGERVTVEFSAGAGLKHLQVVPAADVVREAS